MEVVVLSGLIVVTVVGMVVIGGFAGSKWERLFDSTFDTTQVTTNDTQRLHSQAQVDSSGSNSNNLSYYGSFLTPATITTPTTSVDILPRSKA